MHRALDCSETRKAALLPVGGGQPIGGRAADAPDRVRGHGNRMEVVPGLLVAFGLTQSLDVEFMPGPFLPCSGVDLGPLAQTLHRTFEASQLQRTATDPAPSRALRFLVQILGLEQFLIQAQTAGVILGLPHPGRLFLQGRGRLFLRGQGRLDCAAGDQHEADQAYKAKFLGHHKGSSPGVQTVRPGLGTGHKKPRGGARSGRMRGSWRLWASV